jgi:diguanylate cyclase (GGDEF)-like protein
VGATALSRDGLAAVTLALVAGLSYGAVGLLVASNTPFQDSNLALIGFQVVALVLLAYVGTVAGREQRRAREAALRLARYDPLTGLYNRAHFFASMERELRLAERAGRGFAVLMLDLDGLKPVNDTFGHHYGDRLLQGVTEVIQHSVRATDTPARYGGDEFVILLPDTDAGGAYVVGEKLRKDIAALSIRVNDRSVRTSVSVGLVAYPEDGATVEELMAAVDAALYEAKRSGKDRIVGYTTRTERVATRMGTTGRASAARPSPSSPTPDPDRRGDRPPGTSRPTEPAPERAPWETGTEPAEGSRRRVVVKVEGDSENPDLAAQSARPNGGTEPHE